MKTICFVCEKRLSISNQFKCKCDNIFCSIHRYLESHNCSKIKDIISDEKKLLESQLIKLSAEKIKNRV